MNNNKTKLAGVLVLALLLVVGLGAIVSGVVSGTIMPKPISKTKEAETEKKMEASKETNMVNSAVTNVDKKTEGSMEEKTMDETMTAKAGEYKNYDAADIAKTKDGHSSVLFFNASWCPTCQATVKDINANLSKIDPKLHIFSVDYDSNTALRQKYGVTMQHTFVSVDKDGNMIKKVGGLKNVDEINAFIR